MLPLHNRLVLFAAHSIAAGSLLSAGVKSLSAAGAYADIPAIQSAAQKGRIQDEIALGSAYFTGQGVHQDLKLAAYWYEKAAGSGDPLAQNEIGYLYQVGLGVSPDPARAAHWFQLAASGGFVDAKVNLGVAYMWGIGVPRNQTLAESFLREAAEKGSGYGAAYLGDMYLFGVGVSKDDAAAEPWYEKGAKVHNSLADYRLGTILSRPDGHPRDIQRSVALLRESASAGYVPAMHSLALLFVNHPELGTSPQEAISLLDEAANAGTWKSSVLLGILFRDGKLVQKDERTAYFHFQIAALQGGEAAKNLLRNDLQILGKKLDADQTRKIDKEADSWLQKHNVALQVIYKNGGHVTQFPAFALTARAPGAHAAELVPTNPFR